MIERITVMGDRGGAQETAAGQYDTLTQFNDSKMYKHIAAGKNHTLGIGEDGFLYACGNPEIVHAGTPAQYSLPGMQRLEIVKKAEEILDLQAVYSNASTDRSYVKAKTHNAWRDLQPANKRAMAARKKSIGHPEGVILYELDPTSMELVALEFTGDNSRTSCYNNNYMFAHQRVPAQHPQHVAGYLWPQGNYVYNATKLDTGAIVTETCTGKNFAHYISCTRDLIMYNTADRTWQQYRDADINNSYRCIKTGPYGTYVLVTDPFGRGGPDEYFNALYRVEHGGNGLITRLVPAIDSDPGNDDRVSCLDVAVGGNFVALLTSTHDIYVYTDSSQQWTDITAGQETLPFKQICAGESHLVALDQAGHLWGWGDNSHYQAGDTVRDASASAAQSSSSNSLHNVMLRLRLR